MNVYTTDKIRNVVLLGGMGRPGETSLVEAVAYLSGITNRMGRKISDKILSVIMIKKRQSVCFPLIHL